MKGEFYTASQICQKRSFLQQTPKMLERRYLRLFGKDRLREGWSEKLADPEDSAVYFPDERMDTGREKGGDQGEASRSSRSSGLKGEWKESCRDSSTVLPRRPLHRESRVARRL